MKYTINDHIEIPLESLTKGSIIRQTGDEYRFLYNEKLYDIRVMSYNPETKTYQMKVNGYRLKIQRSDKIDELIHKLGFNQPPKVALKEVLAPMPGLVKEVYVKAGDEIKTGDNLFILEAMKMENIIKAAGEGVISAVMVNQGDKVEKNGLLAKL